MFDDVIISIAEGIIKWCGKTLLQKFSLRLKRTKIRKELRNKLQYLILEKHGEMIYYNSLDSFLTKEGFVEKLISYCFDPGISPFGSIKAYITYLSEKFINANPNYYVEKTHLYQDLFSLSKIVFDIINDYSKDETARIIITQLNDSINSLYAQLFQQNNESIALIKKLIVNVDDKKLVDLDNAETEKLYKASLLSQYIFQSDYVKRNIYNQNGQDCSSVECLLRDKQIVLLGDPGSGKTFEAINVIKQVCSLDTFAKHVPIYMNLIEYGVVYNSIFEYIKQQLRPYYGAVNAEQLRTELSSEKFVIVLDGADEIFNTENRLKFYAEINQLLSSTNAYFFITSRINPYYGNIKNIVEYRIKDLTKEQITKELQNSGINMNLSLEYYDLFANPLFLRIGIQVLKNTNKRIYNKSQLFSAYIEEVCYKRDRAKQLDGATNKNYYNLLMSIGELAFCAFNQTSLSISEFDSFFRDDKNNYTTNNICDVFRIDIFKISNKIAFSHKQFKEFFAAYYLVNKFDINENREQYSELMNKEEWQEVMIFSSGLITNIDHQDSFLDMILGVNLKTYINCVKYKNDLSESYNSLSHEEYCNKYLRTLYKTYTLLINTYFSDLYEKFEPFKIKQSGAAEKKKVCLIGSISEDRKHLEFWFDWKDNKEQSIQLIDRSDLAYYYKDMEKRAFFEGRNIITHGVNLELSGLMGDSARQVSIDIIYGRIKDIIDRYQLFESDYILYEKLCNLTKSIKLLKGKTLREIADWATEYVDKVRKEFDSSYGGMLAGVHYNKTNVINVMNISNYLISKGGTDEKLSLPQPDLPLVSGWIWSVYSNERVIERLKLFFLWRQISFHEMVENNFPKMKSYFSLSKDAPYKYKVYLRFKDTDDFTSDPSITYYRISIKQGESSLPEIIDSEPYPATSDESIFSSIMNSFHNNGKECNSISITSTGFSKTLTSHRSGLNLPLTDVVYEDFKDAFKEIFE